MAYDKKRKEVYFSLGSNLGNRKENILKAIGCLEESLSEKTVISPFYESKALGFESEKDFLNICAKVHTTYSPEGILKLIHEIENELGRIRVDNSGYIDRIIDIDVLFYDQFIIDTKNLKIPHPHIYHRKFVLTPLLNIAKNLVDPRTGKNLETLLESCNDNSNLLLYED